MRNIDDYSTKYAIHGFEDYQVKYRRKMILEQIERYKPQSILEIGCGYEPLFKYVSGIRFTVIEPSEQFYEAAKKMADMADHILCLKGRMEDLAGELSCDYDMVICSSLLHEVENPKILLHSIKKVCNDKTIIHINVPNANSMHRLLAVESGIISSSQDMSERNKLFQQNRVFDSNTFIGLIEECEIKVLEHGSYFVKPFTHEQMYTMLEQNIINEKILDGLFEIEKYIPGMGSEIYANCKIIEKK